MSGFENRKLPIWTVTTGTIQAIDNAYDTIKVRGAVTFKNSVNLNNLFIIGQLVCHSDVVVGLLKNRGACFLKDKLEARRLVNTGHLSIKEAQVVELESFGVIKVKGLLQTDQFQAKGVMSIGELHGNHIEILMSGKCKIEKLIGKEVFVNLTKNPFSLTSKKLISKDITGKNLSLTFTEAECVKGDYVTIGPYCVINTLYYKDYYKIDPTSKVEHIIYLEGDEE